MDKLELRTYDGIAVTGLLILPPLFSTGLSKLVRENNTAVWIALLAAAFIMICLYLIAAVLMKRYEGRNIIEITSMVMGRPVGILYGTALSLFFCYFTGIHIRENAEILKIYGLTLTPIYIVAGLILFSALIMNFFGGRAVVKSAGFFFIIIILGVIFTILLGLNHYDPDNLVPVLGNGLPDIAKNSLFTTSAFDSVLILFLFAPAFSNSVKMKKSGVISIAVTAAAYVLLCLCSIMAFSPSVASKMMSGFIEMGKSSYYNHFFYRFESILLFFLVFSSVMLASIGFLTAKESFASAFQVQRSKSLLIICAVLVSIAAFLPANILDLTEKYLPLIERYSIFFMAGFPLLVWIVSTVKRVFKYEKN